MKRILLIVMAALLVCAPALPALGEETGGRLITVGGTAVVTLAADTASIQIGVNTQKETVQEAQKENARIMAAVMEAIRGAGIDDKDIMTSQFNVFSNYEYGVDPSGKESRTLYYQVQNNVTVTIHDLSLIGPVLDGAMEAGANTTYGITFSSSQANEAYQKALTRAVEDAMQKARVLAQAAGVKLGNLMSVRADQNMAAFAREAYGVSNTYLYSAKSADMGTTITTGDVSVSADVTLEFAFE